MTPQEKLINDYEKAMHMKSIVQSILTENRLPRTDTGDDKEKENAITLERLRHAEMGDDDLLALIAGIVVCSMESQSNDTLLRKLLPEFFAIPSRHKNLSFVDAVKTSRM